MRWCTGDRRATRRLKRLVARMSEARARTSPPSPGQRQTAYSYSYSLHWDYTRYRARIRGDPDGNYMVSGELCSVRHGSPRRIGGVPTHTTILSFSPTYDYSDNNAVFDAQ